MREYLEYFINFAFFRNPYEYRFINQRFLINLDSDARSIMRSWFAFVKLLPRKTVSLLSSDHANWLVRLIRDRGRDDRMAEVE